MSINSKSDVRFIKLALELAKRGIGQTGSNPSVGCVIVKESRIIGRGFTGKNGEPHAETVALKHAGNLSRGATMFVTLEPCSHYGKTPPCAHNIIESGIARVVCPLIDPDPRVSGSGFNKLKKADIQVDNIPIATIYAAQVARGFISRITHGRPFITVKLGISLDGKIATKSGKSQWITNKHLRNRSHLLRAKNDAILVGTNTFARDNPKLNVRGTLNNLSNPLRVFLDYRLETFPSQGVLTNISESRSLIVCGENPNLKNLKIWENSGVEILKIPSSNKTFDLRKLVELLGLRGINSLLVEGGGKIVKSLLEKNLIDELIVHRSGIIIGSDGVPSVFTFKKNSQEISELPRMVLQSVMRYYDNLETTWKPV